MKKATPQIGTKNINRWISAKQELLTAGMRGRSKANETGWQYYKLCAEYFVFQNDRQRWEWQWKTNFWAKQETK